MRNSIYRWMYLFALIIFTCTASTAINRLPVEHQKKSISFAYQIDNQRLNNDTDNIINSLAPQSGFWGLSAELIGKNRPFVNWNGDFSFVPASNMKLFTTAVALIRLGPNFRYNTSLLSDAPVVDGVLKGDIVLRGAGDPTISDKFQKNSTAIFVDWAERLKKQGILEIEGNIIGDDDLFDDADVGKGWVSDDDLFCYSARISALSYNDNCIEVFLSPADNPGEPATISMKPYTNYMRLENHVSTSSEGGNSDFHGKRSKNSSSIELKGYIAQGTPPLRFKLSVANPTLFVVTVLKEVLEQKGIIVRGEPIDIDEIVDNRPNYFQLRILASYQSPPLSVIVRNTNKESQNLYAELIFRTLGAQLEGRGSTENAVKAIKQTLRLIGIEEDSLSVTDGSGLSRLNLVTPNQIVRLLEYMSHQPFFDEFYSSLPIAGTDGTLAGRMINTAMTGRLRAKTGSLAHTSALSGYLYNRKDELVAFSIMTNNVLSPSKVVHELQDALCQQILTLDVEQ